MAKFSPSTVVRAYCIKYPDAPARTIARRILADHPKLYSSLDACRTAVRKEFGVQGNKNRAYQNEEAKKMRRAPRPAGWQGCIPEGRTHFKEWGPYEIQGACRILGLQDIHAPFHDAKALKQAIQYGVDYKANVVVLNGDIADHFAQSFYESDPRKRDTLGEIESVSQVLVGIRRAFPRAKIIFKKGNHEERWFRYICQNAPELLDLPELSLSALFKMGPLKVECVPDRRPIKFGDEWFVIHGHEAGNANSSPISAARTFWNRMFCNVIGGHLHTSSSYTAVCPVDKTRTTTAYSAGCLCGLAADYSPMNKWNHGFWAASVAKSGKTAVQNIRSEDL